MVMDNANGSRKLYYKYSYVNMFFFILQCKTAYCSVFNYRTKQLKKCVRSANYLHKLTMFFLLNT